MGFIGAYACDIGVGKDQFHAQMFNIFRSNHCTFLKMSPDQDPPEEPRPEARLEPDGALVVPLVFKHSLLRNPYPTLATNKEFEAWYSQGIWDFSFKSGGHGVFKYNPHGEECQQA